MTIQIGAVVLALANTLGIVICATGSASGGVQSASNGSLAVAQRYCRLDADGARLTSEGRRQLAELMAPTDMSVPAEVTVVSALSVNGQTMATTEKALVRVDWTYAGSLNLDTARLKQEAPGLHLGGDLTLTRSQGKWRVEGPLPAYVGVAAAIKHVVALREKTADPSIRKNADRTLSALRRIRSSV